jgi:chromosome segregation ATPase
MEIDRKWDEAESKLLEAQLEVFLRNADEKNLVAPLRAAQAKLASAQSRPDEAKLEGRAALELQQQWNSWMDERELLKNEIKRGNECLAQIQDDLADTRDRLEEWAAYERHCGKNPLFDFMQTIAIKERLERFLPRWLARREAQLERLNRNIELCACEHGLDG